MICNVNAYVWEKVKRIIMFTQIKLGQSHMLCLQRPRLLCSIYRINPPGRYACNTKIAARLLYELVNYRLILYQFHSTIICCCDTPNFLVGVYRKTYVSQFPKVVHIEKTYIPQKGFFSQFFCPV